MTRQRKTPAQRAQEAYDIERRRAARLAAKVADAKSELTALEAELADASKRRDYLAAHPDLPAQIDAPTGDISAPPEKAAAKKAASR
jgi:multidrug efflux pump subunit AcrA (membrane-fusion protein)